MKTLNPAQARLKFKCIYCGQRMECDPLLNGRQILCPTCLHRIVVPTPREPHNGSTAFRAIESWDRWIPLPRVEIPTRHRNGMPRNPALAS